MVHTLPDWPVGLFFVALSPSSYFPFLPFPAFYVGVSPRACSFADGIARRSKYTMGKVNPLGLWGSIHCLEATVDLLCCTEKPVHPTHRQSQWRRHLTAGVRPSFLFRPPSKPESGLRNTF